MTDPGYEQEMLIRHLPLAYSIARDYYLPGADRDDVRQEALIGLLAAVRTWRSDLGSFPSFAALCVRRSVVTALRTAGRGKRRVLTEAVGDHEMNDLPGRAYDPVVRLEEVEELRRLRRAVRLLTRRERDALALCLNGEPYAYDQSLDNALQRARRKLRAAA